MKNFFGGQMRAGLGQYISPGWGTSADTKTVITPVPAPVPTPAAAAEDISSKLDASTVEALKSVVKQSKADRAKIEAWWNATLEAPKILGDRLSEYSAALQAAMLYDDLIDRLEFRFDQGGDVYIHDWELEGLKKYQLATQQLVEIVEGKINTEIPPAPGQAETKDVLMSGGIATAAFALAAIL